MMSAPFVIAGVVALLIVRSVRRHRRVSVASATEA